MVRNSKQVTISNSRFHNLRNGMGMLALDGIRVQNNEFTDIRSDGVHGGDISNAEISGNLFTDFHPAAADHPDAMQLWSTPRATTLENIAIHDNLVVRGGGQPMQGFTCATSRTTWRSVTWRNPTTMSYCRAASI